MGNIIETIFSSEGTSEIVTLDEAKEWAFVDTEDDDDMITALITAARQLVEAYCSVSLVSRTITIRTIGNMEFYLPNCPLGSVSSLVDKDANAITYTLYGAVFPKISYSASSTGHSILTYTATADSGEAYKTAIKMIIKDFYETRGENQNKIIKDSIPAAARVILAPKKKSFWQ